MAPRPVHVRTTGVDRTKLTTPMPGWCKMAGDRRADASGRKSEKARFSGPFLVWCGREDSNLHVLADTSS
jgi:hypothetical protein